MRFLPVILSREIRSTCCLAKDLSRMDPSWKEAVGLNLSGLGMHRYGTIHDG